MRHVNYTKLWVDRNLSRHATWHQRSYQIILNQGNQSKSTKQYDCKLFFRLDGTCNSMVKLSNSAGWDFDSTIKFNASTGEEHCECFVCGVCGTEVAFDINQIGFTISSLFSPETSKLQSAVYSELKQFWLTLHSCWIQWEKKISWGRIDILALAKLLT